jgi:peptide deformylase
MTNPIKWFISLFTKREPEPDPEPKYASTTHELLETTKHLPLLERVKRVIVQDEVMLKHPCYEIDLTNENELHRMHLIIEDLMRCADAFLALTAGLSANQIGWPYKVFIVRTGEKEFKPMVNAKIIGTKGGRRTMSESCLSRIGKSPIPAKRWKEIYVEYFDTGSGAVVKDWVTDKFVAQVIQHEIDHGNGKLI